MIMIVVDELAHLMMQQGKEVEILLTRGPGGVQSVRWRTATVR